MAEAAAKQIDPSSREKCRAHPKIAASGCTGCDADLRWFFGPAQAEFERSTFGPVLERQALFAFDTHACATCGGSGFDADDNQCKPCRGMGFRSEARGNAHTSKDASPCRKCKAATGRRECEVCAGRGYVDGWDAVPGPGDGSEASYTPSLRKLERYGRVSRALGGVPRLYYTALQAFYGQLGLSWAEEKVGRIFAVYGLTTSGRRLANLGSTEDGVELTVDQKLAVQYELHRLECGAPDANRRRLMHRADKEARELFARAMASYRRALGVSWRDEFEEIKVRVRARGKR